MFPWLRGTCFFFHLSQNKASFISHSEPDSAPCSLQYVLNRNILSFLSRIWKVLVTVPPINQFIFLFQGCTRCLLLLIKFKNTSQRWRGECVSKRLSTSSWYGPISAFTCNLVDRCFGHYSAPQRILWLFQMWRYVPPLVELEGLVSQLSRCWWKHWRRTNTERLFAVKAKRRSKENCRDGWSFCSFKDDEMKLPLVQNH